MFLRQLLPALSLTLGALPVPLRVTLSLSDAGSAPHASQSDLEKSYSTEAWIAQGSHGAFISWGRVPEHLTRIFSGS